MSDDYTRLPPDLPVPEDDGAAAHLPGLAVPTPLSRLDGGRHGRPCRSRPGAPWSPTCIRGPAVPASPCPAGWDDIPGARGCTPQSCAFRDALDEFAGLGASVVGISAQSSEDQLEFAQREQIPFPLLSDAALKLSRELRLPTFEAGGMTLYRRLTFVAEQGTIVKAFYPVFPPDRNAADVLAWLAGR